MRNLFEEVGQWLGRPIWMLPLLLATLGVRAQEANSDDVYAVDDAAMVADSLAEDSLSDDTLFVDVLPAMADSVLSDSARAAQAEAVAAWRANVREKLARRVEDTLFETAQLGFMVWDLTDDELLFAHGERQRLRPASTMKVVTAISALDRLGVDYRFATSLYYTGGLRDSSHTLDGRLYLVGGMDPYLSQADFAAMADSLRAMGVDTITGGIYSDYSFKDRKRLGAGWCWDDGDDNPNLSPLTYQGRDDAATQLRSALRAKGIVLQGGSYEGERPRDARIACVCYRPIATVMRPMMKFSNNRCAESVFYQLAHQEGGRGASAKSAARAIGHTLRRADLHPERYVVADGCGLSLYNYVSAEMEVRLLRYAFGKKEIFEALYPLLPVAGRDGTLRRRLHGTAAQGNVHAKTGTVTGIRSLAGYCTARNGHVLAFAIIVQGVESGGPAHAWQDKVCKILCE